MSDEGGEDGGQKVMRSELAASKDDRDYWHDSSVAEGKAKLRAEGQLRAQERATQQLSAEVTALQATLDTRNADAERYFDALQVAEARVRELEAAIAATETIRVPGALALRASKAEAALVKRDAAIRELRGGK